MTVAAEVAALNLLARHGLEVIWQLHLDAAAAHRDGNGEAETLVEIADAAEAWLRKLVQMSAPELRAGF
jgi:hypothetical protein